MSYTVHSILWFVDAAHRRCEIIRGGMDTYLTPMGPTKLHVAPIFEIGPLQPTYSGEGPQACPPVCGCLSPAGMHLSQGVHSTSAASHMPQAADFVQLGHALALLCWQCVQAAVNQRGLQPAPCSGLPQFLVLKLSDSPGTLCWLKTAASSHISIQRGASAAAANNNRLR